MRAVALTMATSVLLGGSILAAPPTQAAEAACSPTIALGNLSLDDLGTASYTITVTASPLSDLPGGCSGDATFIVDGFQSYLDAGETNTYPGRSVYACGRTITGSVQQGGATVSSNPLVVGVLPPNKPTTPSLVTAQATSLTASWVSNIDACHPVTNYQLTTGLGGAVASTLGTQATLDGLNPATMYSVSVIAVNAAGSTSSDARSMTTAAAPIRTPAAPQNLTASGLQTTSVRLAWSAPASPGTAPITGYQVSVGCRVATTVVGTTADLTGLAPNTGYTASVVALNSAGAGTPATVGFRTASPVAPTAVPGAVTNFRVSATTSTSAVLDWSAPVSDGGSPITGYLVVNRTTGDQRALSPTTTETAFSLSPGTTYAFTVTALNARGAGPVATTAVTTDPQGGSDRGTQTIAVDVHTGQAWRSGRAHYAGQALTSAGQVVTWSVSGRWVKSFSVQRRADRVFITVVLKRGAPKATHVTIDARARATAQYDAAHVTNGVRVHR